MVTITKKKALDTLANSAVSESSSKQSGSASSGGGKVTITKRPVTAENTPLPVSNTSGAVSNKAGSAYAPRSTSQWKEVGGGRVSTSPQTQIQSKNGLDRRVTAKSSRGEQKGHTLTKRSVLGGGAGRGGMTREEAVAGINAAQGHQIEDFSAAKLVGGAAVKGIDSAMGGLTSTAEWLVGQNITGLGKIFGQDWSNNPVSALNRRVQQAKETNQAYFQPNVERGGRIAEAVDKYGTATAAAIPQAMAAIATAGGSMAAQGTTTGLQAVSAAAQSGGILSAAQNIIQNLAKDPQYWLSFSQVAGDSYQQAKADGASDAAANLYALANGLGNAAVEVGGGIQTLPKELQQGKNALKAWAESMVDEGKEEVAQGILERGLQNLIYHKKNQLASLTDENAVLNPRTAAEEFAGGAVVGGILGGGQTLLNSAVNRAQTDRANLDTAIPQTNAQIERPETAPVQAQAAPAPIRTSQGEGTPSQGNPVTQVPVAYERYSPEDFAQIESIRSSDVDVPEEYSGEVVNDNPESLKPTAATLGESGKKAMLAFYDGEVDTDLYAKDFVAAYNAGIRGEARPTENYITQGQAVAAYFSGQNDAKTTSDSLNLQQENHIMSKNNIGREYRERTGEAGDKILTGEGKPDTGRIETVSGTVGDVSGISRVRLEGRLGNVENGLREGTEENLGNHGQEANAVGQIEKQGINWEDRAPMGTQALENNNVLKEENGNGLETGGAENPAGDIGTQRKNGIKPGLQSESGIGAGSIQQVSEGIRKRYEKQVNISNSAKEYDISVEFTSVSDWPVAQKDNISYTNNGKIFIKDDFPIKKAEEILPHEAIHAMRQTKFSPYLDFLEGTPDEINRSAPDAQSLLEAVAKHRGLDLLNLSEKEVSILYDEVNALVSGAVVSGKDSLIAENLNNAFLDFDSYKNKLLSIHDKFKGRNRQNGDEGTSAAMEKEKNPTLTLETISGTDGLGAADAGFDPYSGLQNKYGTIEPGENPAHVVDVPKKTADDWKVSQTVRTVMEAGATPVTALPTIEEMVVKGDFSYEVYSDKQAIADAAGEITEKGYPATLSDWTADVRGGDVSKKHTAMGWALYNAAVNAGDMKTAMQVLTDIVGHQRNAAQAVQATRILKQMPADAQLYTVQRSVSNLEKELKERYGNKAPDLKIDEELAERFKSAEDQTARDTVLWDIYRSVGKQMPSRFIDKWNAWRYLAMLGNPRTHVRNVLGNAFFAPVVGVKNVVAAGIETGISKATGGKIDRSKGLVGIGKNDRALLSAAVKDYAVVQEEALGSGKYTDLQNANRYIEEGRTIFQPGKITRHIPGAKLAAKGLEAARKANGTALDVEDIWFSRPHYAAAMAQYCKANGITAEQIAEGENGKLGKARAYAIREAQKATYRDTNMLSDLFSRRFRESGEHPAAAKAANTVMEGILPFRKTPANILARGLEYSPLGLLNGIKKAVLDVQRGRSTAAEAIDNISAGLTGTGLLALGTYLAAQGLLRGAGGGDDKEKDFKKLQGHQSYSLELPDGSSVTLDWLAPEVLPLFVGVNLYEQTAQQNEDITMAALLSAVGNVTEPLLEMSCLQSLNDVFDAVGYASSNDMNGLSSALASAATSYVTQAFPTVFGQIERTSEDRRMTTYTEKNAFLTPDMQYTLGKISGKTPGEYHQIPYIDAWGRTESTGGIGERAFNNFVNPAYTSTVNTSAMEKELQRLYDVTGEGGVFPSRADKKITVDGVDKYLTAEEYVKYATVKGQNAYSLLEDLTASTAYRKLNDDEKVKAVKDAYDMANKTAKASISDYEVDSWMQKAAEAEEKYRISNDTYLTLRSRTAGIESLKDKNGETIPNSKSLLVMQEVYNTPGLSDKQRQAMFEYLGVGKTIRHWNKALVAEKLAAMRRIAK